MPNMTLISSGPLSTVQDGGRFGYMSMGFSPNGAMDTYSMKLANLLVGNSPDDGVIEMTLIGMSVRFDCMTVIAITGADMQPKLNDQPIAMYSSVPVAAGDRLTMSAATKGMRAYLAVAGGFDVPEVMGSMSTNLKCALGGFEGRKLRAGDVLPLRRSTDPMFYDNHSFVPENDYSEHITARVILGPQDNYFTAKGIDTFLSSTYTVSDKSDRMGIRLDGQPIENINGVDIISDGIVTGSIQIPASGTPIIMMADRQTTGGYAKIATVISVDLKKIAQARPGTKISFSLIDEKQAIRLLKREHRQLKQLQYESFFLR